MEFDDVVVAVSRGFRVSARDILQTISDSNAQRADDAFFDKIKEDDICSILFSKHGDGTHCYVKGDKSFEDTIKKSRLHLNPLCPKRKGRFARPDAVFIDNGRCVAICEVKIHRFGNDCELFNGIVQLKEYLALYGDDPTGGVLFILSHLLEPPNQHAYKFLESLSEERIVILYANLLSQDDFPVVQFRGGHEVVVNTNGLTRRSEIAI